LKVYRFVKKGNIRLRKRSKQTSSRATRIKTGIIVFSTIGVNLKIHCSVEKEISGFANFQNKHQAEQPVSKTGIIVLSTLWLSLKMHHSVKRRSLPDPQTIKINIQRNSRIKSRYDGSAKIQVNHHVQHFVAEKIAFSTHKITLNKCFVEIRQT